MSSRNSDKRNDNLVLVIDATFQPSRFNDWYLVVVRLRWKPLITPSRVKPDYNSQIVLEKSQILDKECTLTLISPKPRYFFKEGLQQSETHHFMLKKPLETGEMCFTWFLPAEEVPNGQERKICFSKKNGIEIEVRIGVHRDILRI